MKPSNTQWPDLKTGTAEQKIKNMDKRLLELKARINDMFPDAPDMVKIGVYRAYRNEMTATVFDLHRPGEDDVGFEGVTLNMAAVWVAEALFIRREMEHSRPMFKEEAAGE